jgi:hypothetical protein
VSDVLHREELCEGAKALCAALDIDPGRSKSDKGSVKRAADKAASFGA